MITLAIDASTYEGSASIIVDGVAAAEAVVAMKGMHEERLMPAVANVMDEAGVVAKNVDRIVCGAGPGSFTSLRIAGAIAKGIATAARRPLYAVPSMALMIGDPLLAPGRYLTAIDALRGECYVALYGRLPNGRVDEIEPARLVRAEDVDRIADSYGATTAGPSPLGTGVVAPPRASAVVHLEHMLAAREPVDVATWEPSYGRLAEAQVRWESVHGKPLPAG